ncbi:MAG: HD domain-containing protein [Candidatus Eremiobacteraeota bacterium]|nr:HD domain-containing protein [Candidatus Eremiobacteraeota bacterium]
MNIKIPFREKIIQIADQLGINIYLVGGSLRNLLLNVPINDWDFAVTSKVFEFSRKLADETNSHFVLLDKDFGIARVVPRSREFYMDFALTRGDIDNDLISRDFTINSLALNLKEDKLIDPAGGMGDLDKKIVRTLSRKCIIDDPLRILRAYRMKAKFRFEIEESTRKWILEEKEKIKSIAFERIRDEIFKIFTSHKSTGIIRQIYNDGILGILIPELIPLDGLKQSGFHKYDALQHSFHTLEEVEKLEDEDYSSLEKVIIQNKSEDVIARNNDSVLPLKDLLKDYFSEISVHERYRMQVFKFATLLHDIGKIEKEKIVSRGHIYYPNHHTCGRDIWNKIANRFKLSNKEKTFGAKVVEYHLAPIFISKEKEKRAGDLRKYKLFERTRESAPAVILISWADVEAGRGESLTNQMIERHHDLCISLMKSYFVGDPIAKPPQFLDGKDVMEILRLKSGKKIGNILSALNQASALGDVVDYDQACSFVKFYYKL